MNQIPKSQDELRQYLLSLRESYDVELKASSDLPGAFWDTYSSFANTSGGIIVLGVAEGDPENTIIGVGNPQHVLNSLWNILSNDNKVSYRTVGNQDVTSITVDDKTVILVHVPEAPENIKPVYINGKVDNTYIRTGDGDRKANKSEIAAMLRNANPDLDTLPVEGCTMADLDQESVLRFKQQMAVRYPNKHYLEMDHAEFLTENGFCRVDRQTGELRILRGALLCLGKVNSIREYYPHYHLDYYNRRGDNARWIDRVSDDEPGDLEMNIYNFYNIVDEKLRLALKEAFRLDADVKRLPATGFDETLRECLVNCLAHADYEAGYPSTRIQAYDGWYSFENPGGMLISTQQFVMGGDSRPRNEIIMKMFRLIGASERQGFGGPLIYKTAQQNAYRRPEIESDLQHTQVRVWNVDLADSYPQLDDETRSILQFVEKNHRLVSVTEIAKALDVSYYKAQKSIRVLEEMDVLRRVGNGSATKYGLQTGSVELLTQLQIAMDIIRHSIV